MRATIWSPADVGFPSDRFREILRDSAGFLADFRLRGSFFRASFVAMPGANRRRSNSVLQRKLHAKLDQLAQLQSGEKEPAKRTCTTCHHWQRDPSLLRHGRHACPGPCEAES